MQAQSGAVQAAAKVGIGEEGASFFEACPAEILMFLAADKCVCVHRMQGQEGEHALPAFPIDLVDGCVEKGGVKVVCGKGKSSLFGNFAQCGLHQGLLCFGMSFGQAPTLVPSVLQEKKLGVLSGAGPKHHPNRQNRAGGRARIGGGGRANCHRGILPAGGRYNLPMVAAPSAASVIALVEEHRPVGPDAFLLQLALPQLPDSLAPGVFAMLSPEDGSGPEIARPFSLYDCPGPNQVSFLIQTLGCGTRALAALPPGSAVRCTFPLGNGFQVAAAERTVVMVAGGVGSAPFLLYAQKRVALGAGANTHFFFGARSGERLYDRQAFASLAICSHFATDDGSLGFAGNVLAAVEAALADNTIPAEALFLACGPAGLLHGFASFARARKLDAWLSLETYMGCGYGVCNACPVPTEAAGALGAWPYARTCTDGPVFSLRDIQF